MLTLLVDFNNIRGGVVRGLGEHVGGEGALEVGARVRLYDGEEHAAWGTIERIEGPVVYTAMDWSTWQTVLTAEVSRGERGRQPVFAVVTARAFVLGDHTEALPEMPDNEAGPVPVGA